VALGRHWQAAPQQLQQSSRLAAHYSGTCAARRALERESGGAREQAGMNAAFLADAYTGSSSSAGALLSRVKAEPQPVEADGGADEGSSGSSDDDAAPDRSDVLAAQSEKLYLVKSYLQSLPGHPFVSFAHVAEQLGVDLHVQEDVLERLKENDRIDVDTVGARLKFNPRLDIRDLASLLAALDKNPDGLQLSEVIECGPKDIGEAVERAVVSGAVIAVRNRGTSNATTNIVLFPRGPVFLVPIGSGRLQLDGAEEQGGGARDTGSRKRYKLNTGTDVRSEVRRGDVLVVGRQGAEALAERDLPAIERNCVRVSLDLAGTRNEADLAQIMDHLSRLPTPYSRSSQVDPLPPKGGADYRRALTDSKVPLMPAFAGDASGEVSVFKHGCTNDLREVWRSVCKRYQYRPQDSATVNRLLAEEGLASGAWIDMGANVSGLKRKQVVKKKKRQGRKVTNLTNAHLEEA
jgi:hypothetical protein